MTTIASTPAASRIAQIRSALGQRGSVGGSGDFVRQLASFQVQNATTPSSFTVGDANSAASPAAAPTASPTTAPTSVGIDSMTRVGDDVPYAALFNEIGERYGVDPALLASVAQIESAFDPSAISPAGAQGLMQFMPATAGEMGVDSFDPASAVDGAARYLRRELDRFGSVELALAAYNAGPGAVQRHGGVPPFPETQRYVEKVLSAHETHQVLESN